ncbi:MAG: DUF4835 family protein [Cytophagaceae bacterium]
MRLLFLISAFIFGTSCLYAQGELNCTVVIDAENVQTSEREIFQQLKNNITDFLNNRKWTNDEFKPEERITCNIVINLTGFSGTSFEGTALVQSSRPMYNTNKETILLKFLDRKFNFNWAQGQPLLYTENTYTDNLTAMLAFYAYIILGLDYDSFGKLGGTKYFEKARDIAMNAQNQAGGAWDPNENPNNRFNLMFQLNNQQFIPFREGLYSYHRIAMDQFMDKPDDGRKEIMQVFEKIRKVYDLNPSSVVIKNFFNAKMDEIINIFKGAPTEMKDKVLPMLTLMDPLNSEKYAKINAR